MIFVIGLIALYLRQNFIGQQITDLSVEKVDANKICINTQQLNRGTYFIKYRQIMVCLSKS